MDREAFPIFDTWAQWSVRHHLGTWRKEDGKHPYVAFVANLHTIIALAKLRSTPSDLDSYLWIRGGFEVWRRRPDAPFNGELKAFFKANERGSLLKRLVREDG